MNSVAQKLCFSALLGLALTACNSVEPTPLTTGGMDFGAGKTGPSQTDGSPTHLTDGEWIEAVLEKLDQDPQKDFDLESLTAPSSREFTEWAEESLLAASFGPNQGDISVSLQDLVEGNPNLSLWFSEEFTKDVLEVNAEAATSPSAVEAGEGVLVPVIQSSTKLRTAECRPEPANLCALVLTVDWHVNNVQALLVFVSSLEEGKWNLRLFNLENATYRPVQSVEEYLAQVQAEQENRRQALAEKCQVNPLEDELGCQEALGIDEQGLKQLVIHLCSSQTAEGATLDQCAARFVQYCSNPQDDAQLQICENMARAGFSLEEPEGDSEVSGDDTAVEQDDQDLEEESDEDSEDSTGDSDSEDI